MRDKDWPQSENVEDRRAGQKPWAPPTLAEILESYKPPKPGGRLDKDAGIDDIGKKET